MKRGSSHVTHITWPHLSRGLSRDLNIRHSDVANGADNRVFGSPFECCRLVTLGPCSLPLGRIPLALSTFRLVFPCDTTPVLSWWISIVSLTTSASLLFVILSLCCFGGSSLAMWSKSLFRPDAFCQKRDSWKLNTFSGIFASASAILNLLVLQWVGVRWRRWRTQRAPQTNQTLQCVQVLCVVVAVVCVSVPLLQKSTRFHIPL